MSSRIFQEILGQQQAKKKFLCVGLDPDWEMIPQRFKDENNNALDATLAFLKWIVDQTGDIVGAFKPNIAFFSESPMMLEVLRDIIEYINKKFPEVLVILDFKRGDIGKTNAGYVREFNYYGGDAMTIHSYLGRQANLPFLNLVDKGIFILCHTSNKGAEEIQELIVKIRGEDMYRNGDFPVFQLLARNIASEWNELGNCGLVVGATFPEQLKVVRREIGDGMTILIPGVGTQGGDLEKSVKNGMDSTGSGFLINVSSGVIYKPDPRKQALDYHNQILACLPKTA